MAIMREGNYAPSAAPGPLIHCEVVRLWALILGACSALDALVHPQSLFRLIESRSILADPRSPTMQKALEL